MLDRENKAKAWDRLGETGQMSVFVALIFQVLFVFFAMVINIGLLVHDKINLQNAVDLGAYYAAQRQAEIMNEIAHINYQLRQDYKLLTWRYRALGTIGRHGQPSRPTEQTLPPLRKENPGALAEKEWINNYYGPEQPSLCVANNFWSEYIKNSSEEENMCAVRYKEKIPRIPDLPVIAPFVPGVASAAAFTKQAQEAQFWSCKRSGVLNWAFTMQIMYAYKLSIATRKEILRELRRNLISAEMKDRNEESVKDGVKMTIIKNLTWANRTNAGSGFQDTDLEVINGLADPNCNRGDDGEFILPEILTVPTVLYTNYKCDDGNELYQVAHSITDNLDPDELSKWDPSNVMRNLARGEPQPTSPIHSTLGFEKNPWCMAYMGVKAKTRVRKPFAPLGQPIQLEARAFAQPFGGRIGPWYKERWARGAPASSDGDRLDPLTSPRLFGGTLDNTAPVARLPNFSRFPGDKLGLKSELSLGAQNRLIRAFGPPRDKKDRLKLEWYGKFEGIPTTGDPLVNKDNDVNFSVRKAEMSAVLPDLFDITYYSIDPNYTNAFVKIGPERFNPPPIFGQTVKQIPDIGGRPDVAAVAAGDIEKQIASGRAEGIDPALLQKLYYLVEDWRHLLTGWAAPSAQNFGFPAERFGRCQTSAAEAVPVPGRCWMGGGRVGYSVRLISRNHLLSETWKIGGEGQEGAILNPPPENF